MTPGGHGQVRLHLAQSTGPRSAALRRVMPALVWLQDSRERVFGSGFWNNFRALAEIAWKDSRILLICRRWISCSPLVFQLQGCGPSSTPNDERSEDLICKARDE